MQLIRWVTLRELSHAQKMYGVIDNLQVAAQQTNSLFVLRRMWQPQCWWLDNFLQVLYVVHCIL